MNQSIFIMDFHNYTLGNESVLYNNTGENKGQLATFFTSIGISLPITLLGIIANIIVLVILYKKGNHRTVFDLTIVSLSATDLLACTFAFIYTIKGLAIYLIPQKSDGSPILRIAAHFFLLSLIHVLLITFMRFCAIFWPMKYRHDMTKAKLKKLIALIWILCLAVLPPVLNKFKKKSYTL